MPESEIKISITKVFKTGESSEVQLEGTRNVKRKVNLDLIIAMGYRVNSQRGIQFRIWANKVLKEAYVINHRIEKPEKDVNSLKGKVDEFNFQIKTNLPPNEGIFYNGQIRSLNLFNFN